MKKILLAITVVSLLGSCFIFKKKEKYGCPGSPQPGQLTNDQKIASGQKVKETKYKGGKKSY
ncbi:MAG: hypothetical protein H7X88_05395 [Gloeobacteraceae cyanobacterium ES-bin-316]|nr:hypothetical protein [Ferruginibacter sp.]